jgi:hypothetical protein
MRSSHRPPSDPDEFVEWLKGVRERHENPPKWNLPSRLMLHNERMDRAFVEGRKGYVTWVRIGFAVRLVFLLVCLYVSTQYEDNWVGDLGMLGVIAFAAFGALGPLSRAITYRSAWVAGRSQVYSRALDHSPSENAEWVLEEEIRDARTY